MNVINIFFLALFVSFFSSALIIKFRHLHQHFSADNDFKSVQKFHSSPVPRIGGIPIFIGLLLGLLILKIILNDKLDVYLLLVAALPAFLAGLLEDFTKRIGPKPRLLATFIAAFLGYLLLHANLSRFGIPSVNYLFIHYWILSLTFTIFAVGGIAHSINVIDGYNGLASVVAIFVFIALAYISHKVGDLTLFATCLVAIGSIVGFICFNFPLGLIFLGDGGAYIIGFLIAEISVLLVQRNPTVSPWFPLLLVAYPFFETVFSSYRKKILRNMSPSQPDGLHLHMLIYKRMVRLNIGSKKHKDLTQRNSLTSPYLWLLCLLCVIPAVIFWDNTIILMMFFLLFIISYVLIYRKLVLFQIPYWMILKSRSKS